MFACEQFLDVVAAIHSDRQMRDLAADVGLEGLGRAEHVAFLPRADAVLAMVYELRQPLRKRSARIRTPQRLAHFVVFGPIHARQRPCSAERALKILYVVL